MWGESAKLFSMLRRTRFEGGAHARPMRHPQVENGASCAWPSCFAANNLGYEVMLSVTLSTHQYLTHTQEEEETH